MSRFKVGDVCVFTEGATWAITGANVGGIECVVIGGLEERHIWPPGDERPCYEVMCEQIAKHPLLAEPHELRLRRPPSWDKWLYDTRGVDSEHREPTRA